MDFFGKCLEKPPRNSSRHFWENFWGIPEALSYNWSWKKNPEKFLGEVLEEFSEDIPGGIPGKFSTKFLRKLLHERPGKFLKNDWHILRGTYEWISIIISRKIPNSNPWRIPERNSGEISKRIFREI